MTTTTNRATTVYFGSSIEIQFKSVCFIHVANTGYPEIDVKETLSFCDVLIEMCRGPTGVEMNGHVACSQMNVYRDSCRIGHC